MQNLVELNTDRLLLKGLSPSNIHHLFNTLSKPQLMTFFGFDEAGYEHHKSMHEGGMETFSTSLFVFLLIEKSTGKSIGECGFHTWNKKHDRADIFYWLTNESDKNKGFMSEALPVVLKYGFEKMNLHRVAAFIDDANIPSKKLLQKNGFQKEGTAREDYIVNGRNEDSDGYSLLKWEWEQMVRGFCSELACWQYSIKQCGCLAHFCEHCLPLHVSSKSCLASASSASSASSTSTSSTVSELCVISFNILAPCYVRVPGQMWNAYPHCSEEDLAWPSRLARIVELLLAARADIVCLQEVELEQRQGAWRLPGWTDALVEAGYDGLAQEVSNRMAERNEQVIGRYVTAGNATFWRKARLTERRPAIHSSRTLCSFFATGEGTPIAVANCHLDGMNEDTQVAQLASTLKKLQRAQVCRLVVAGDFNNELRAGSSLSACIKAHSHQDCELEDAAVGPSWFEPGRGLSLDHLLFSRNSLRLRRAWTGHPTAFQPDYCLPSAQWPSDHVPVGACFQL